MLHPLRLCLLSWPKKRKNVYVIKRFIQWNRFYYVFVFFRGLILAVIKLGEPPGSSFNDPQRCPIGEDHNAGQHDSTARYCRVRQHLTQNRHCCLCQRTNGISKITSATQWEKSSKYTTKLNSINNSTNTFSAKLYISRIIYARLWQG